ncbi:hypothetical protein HBH64_234030 [Parastagonospora nodorum]|nr:hypothetical protein HBH46_213300 [Parastagonospora nodorum]KAH4285238.1 hypothetical protein HBI02_233520 [Parastagonospora nodorum]KAH4319885.1 hypothetical protein HBI00_236290 [Parastagonospora nodorum]KAH4472627.1 hypothetical protein HBH88_246580 [Parastagonospora nodorum]KAH4570125.1 hypothetical protein HBH83_228200 [Parastagonospora nodorum]
MCALPHFCVCSKSKSLVDGGDREELYEGGDIVEYGNAAKMTTLRPRKKDYLMRKRRRKSQSCHTESLGLRPQLHPQKPHHRTEDDAPLYLHDCIFACALPLKGRFGGALRVMPCVSQVLAMCCWRVLQRGETLDWTCSRNRGTSCKTARHLARTPYLTLLQVALVASPKARSGPFQRCLGLVANLGDTDQLGGRQIAADDASTSHDLCLPQGKEPAQAANPAVSPQLTARNTILASVSMPVTVGI